MIGRIVFNNNSGAEPGTWSTALDDLIGRTLPRVPRGIGYSGAAAMGLHRPALGGSGRERGSRHGALFLQPSSALLWNTYEGGNPWSDYTMGTAVDRLRQIFPGSGPIVHRAGKQADLMSWHRAIDPLNRFGLILMNSTGGPRHFAIMGGRAGPAIYPREFRLPFRRFIAFRPPTLPTLKRSPAVGSTKGRSFIMAR